MDLSALLDVTEPVECEFLDHKITAHVFTAGINRLRKEDRDKYSELSEGGDPDPILLARALLPVMIGGWDLDGTPMEYAGRPFPPSVENVAQCPDALLQVVANPVIDKWSKANPTTGDLSQNGSEPLPESQSEESLTQTTTA
jgi:hypothetical protein